MQNKASVRPKYGIFIFGPVLSDSAPDLLCLLISLLPFLSLSFPLSLSLSRYLSFSLSNQLFISPFSPSASLSLSLSLSPSLSLSLSLSLYVSPSRSLSPSLCLTLQRQGHLIQEKYMESLVNINPAATLTTL